MGATGWTNTMGVAAIIYGFTGTAVFQTNYPGSGFSRGTVSVPIDITLKPGAFIVGTSCAASGVGSFQDQ